MNKDMDVVMEAYTPTYVEEFPLIEHVDTDGSNKNLVHNGSWPPISQKSVKSSTVTQVFHVPVEERRFKDYVDDQHSPFGKNSTEQAKVCADIMKQFNVSIELSSGRDRSLTVVVSGKVDAVMKARREIVNKLQTPCRHQMHIPKEHHRFILGPKGSRLQKLELDTSTKIQMPRPEEPSDVICLIGSKEGVEKARHEIQLFSDEQAKLAIERLSIPKVFHPFICGPNNRTVNELASSYHVRISVPPLSIMKDEIVISGEKDGVRKASEYIRMLYDDKRRTCQTVSVEVGKAQHRYILGVKASGIHEIMEATNVSVELPPTDSTSETITLRGDHQSLGKALSMVYARANSVIVRVVEAPSWLHRFIIGRGGDNIKAIAADLPKVHIEFQDGLDKINIEGPPEEVNQAELALNMITSKLLKSMSYAEIKIDPKYHRFLVGQKGSNVNRLKTEFGVAIRVPSDGDKVDIIRIEGNPKGVEEARKQLLEMVEKIENEKSRDIIIDQRLHKQLIGAGGKNISEIRDKFNNVQIIFPELHKESDIVTLRGPKNDVDGCYNYLSKLSRDLAEANFVAEVRVYKQFHKNIVGKGGATIRQIRDETNTKIDLPGEGAETDLIKITGRKKDVELAKKKIETIQNTQANMMEDHVKIPQKLHNSLIGSKGRLIKAIMDEHGGVQIHFPGENEKSDVVTLRGPKEDVHAAKKTLKEAADERALQSYIIEIKCKPEYHQFLIGRKGTKVSEIRQKTGARIVFPSRQDKEQIITIIGTQKAAEEAKIELDKRIADLDLIVESNVDIPAQYHKHFLAKRGENLRMIIEEYGGLNVSFPPPQSGKDSVALKGAKDCVEGAKKRMLEIVEDLEAQVTMPCTISQSFHRSIMGSRGANVKKITQDYNVVIKFPSRPDRNTQNDSSPSPPSIINGGENVEAKDTIMITGRKENCENAIKDLLALIPVTKDFKIDQAMHRFIIGKGGEGVRKIMQDHDVQISVPDGKENNDVIKISGVEDAVNDAINALQNRVDQLKCEEEDRKLRSFQLQINVNPSYHPKIIGRKGSQITKIREKHNVNIQFPDKKNKDQLPPDIISITGYEEKCEAAKADILQIVKALDEQTVETIEIPSRVHPRIIGAKGKNLYQLQDKFKVDIRFPGKDSENPNSVVVSGEEDDVFDCCDELRNMAEEYEIDYENRDMFIKPSSDKTSQSNGREKHNDGFKVVGAPWDSNSTTDFPDLSSLSLSSNTIAWGPSVKR